MVYTLQQTSYTRTQLPSRSDETTSEDDLVAIHRRSNTFLMRRKSSYHCCRLEGKGQWKSKSSWSLADNHDDEFPHTIATMPIEALDAFLIIFAGAKSSHAVFLSLDGGLLNDIHIAQRVLCAEIDQSRKELLMGLPGGRVVSYAIRFNIKKGGTSMPHIDASQYLLILRKYIILTSLEPDKSACQLAISDISGICFVLMKDGGIIALETSCLEVLWHVSRQQFVYTPTRLWVDKFGLDFLVLCQDLSEGSTDGEQRRETLEFWTAPITMPECDASQFGRASIPVTESVLSASIESMSVGPFGQEVLVAITTRSHRVQLWQTRGSTGIVRLQCDLSLRRSMEDIRASSASYLFRNASKTLCLPSRTTRITGQSLCFFGGRLLDCAPTAFVTLIVSISCDVAVIAIYNNPPVDGANDRTLRSISYLAATPASFVKKRSQFDISKLPQGVVAPVEPLLLDKLCIPAPLRNPPTNLEIQGSQSLAALSMSKSGLLNIDGYGSSPISPLMSPTAGRKSAMDDLIEDSLVDSARSKETQSSHASISSFSVDITRVAKKDGGKTTHKSSSDRLDVPIITRNDPGQGLGDAVMNRALSPSRPMSVPGTHFPSENGPRDLEPSNELEPSTLTEPVLPVREELMFHPPSSPLLEMDAYHPLPSEPPKVEFFVPIQCVEALNLTSSMLQALLQSNIALNNLPDLDFFVKFISPPSSLLVSVPNPPNLSNPAKTVTRKEKQLVVTTAAAAAAESAVVTGHGLLPAHVSSNLQLITTHGLRDAEAIQNVHPDQARNTIQCRLFALASVAGMAAILTPMHDCFLMNFDALSPTLRPADTDPLSAKAPLRLCVDIHAHAVSTVLVLADVALLLPVENDKLPRTAEKRANMKTTSVEGTHTLCVIGDSNGLLHINLSTRQSTISSNMLKAHSSAVACIVTTGCAMRPLWRVGVQVSQLKPGQAAAATSQARSGKSLSGVDNRKLKPSQPLTQSSPVAVPGSGIISMSKDGEVKIWQPVFSSTANIQSKYEQVFSMSKISWVVSGMYSCVQIGRSLDVIPTQSVFYDTFGNESNAPNANIVVNATVDPTCMTVFIAFGNGRIEQWPLPGLVYSPSSSLATCRKCIWALTAHKGSVLDMRIWTHLPNVLINDVGAETADAGGHGGNAVVRYAAIVRARSALNTTVGYTMPALRNVSDASALVTSSADKSIVMWMFILTDEPILLPGDEFDMNVYVQLFPCRRFMFSDVPRAGLCFGLSPKHDPIVSSLWRISAIVSGVVITVLNTKRSELFASNYSVSAEYLEHVQATSESDSSSANSLELKLTAEKNSDVMVLPSAGLVLKPLRAMDAVNRCTTQAASNVLPKTHLWSVYEYWAKKSTHQKQQQLLDTIADLAAIQNHNLASQGFMDDTLGDGFRVVSARPDSPSNDLHFTPSTSRMSTRQSLTGVSSKSTRDLVPLVLSEAVIETSGLVDDATLTRERLLVESPKHPLLSPPKSPNNDNVSQTFSQHSSSREKIVQNGVRMEIDINDDDSVQSFRSQGSSRRYLASESRQVVEEALVDSLLLSRADAMWERLQSKLDGPVTAGSSSPGKQVGASASSAGYTRGFEPPTPIVEKKPIVSKVSTESLVSPSKEFLGKDRDLTPSSARVRDIPSPMRDTLTAGDELAIDLLKLGESEPLTAVVDSPQNSTQNQLMKSRSQAQLENFIFEGLNNPPLVPRSASPKLRARAGIDEVVVSRHSLDGGTFEMANSPPKLVDKLLNRTAMLRLEQQAKEKERQKLGPKKKLGYSYTSKRSVTKVLDSMNHGVKQVQGNFATFTPPPNYYEVQLNAAVNRVVVHKEEDDDAFDSLEVLHQSEANRHRQVSDDDQSYGSFNDDSTGVSVSYTNREGDNLAMTKPKRAQLTVSKLGVVFHEPSSVNGQDKPQVDAALERTESFAGISTYFSRSAKPIIVDTKPKQVIKKLVSKRHEKNERVVEEMPEGFFEIKLHEPLPEPEPIPAESTEPSLTDEEKEQLIDLFLSLSPEEQQKMLLKHSFLAVAKRVVNALKLTGTPNTPAPEDPPSVTLSIDVVETTSCTINFYTPDGGRIIVLLLNEESIIPSVRAMKSFVENDSSFYSAYPGVNETRVLQVPRGQNEGSLVFDSLNPSTTYHCVAYIDAVFPDEADMAPKKKKAKGLKLYGDMPDDAFAATKIELITRPEELYIAWDSLSIEQQNAELCAAIRCKVVQETAKKSTTVMDLPADVEIAARTSLSSSLAVQSFVQWYTGGYKYGMTPIRSRFLIHEALAAIRTPSVLESYKIQAGVSDSNVASLMVWAVGIVSSVPALMPVTMSDRDYPSMATPATRDVSSAASRGNGKRSLPQSSKAAYIELSMDPIPDELEDVQFRHFRSWYAGGLVMTAVFLKDICSERTAKLLAAKSTKSMSSGKHGQSAVSASTSVADIRPVTASSLPPEDKRVVRLKTQEFASERMKERSAFFEHRVALYDECVAKVGELVHGYVCSVQKGLKDSDLTTKRSRLSDEDVLAIMAASKLMEIFYIRGFSMIQGRMPADISLIGGTSGYYSDQKIVGGDIFDDINPLFFKPNDAPVYMRATIPGTNRRPIKPWQLCTEMEKLMELQLACSMDAIIEMAVLEGLTVPDPEDVMLDPKIFLLRAARWKSFIAWYAGAEALDVMPGRGIPTEMRTIVSEQWERKVLENDPEVFSRMLALGYHKYGKDPEAIPPSAESPQGPGSNTSPPSPQFLAAIAGDKASASRQSSRLLSTTPGPTVEQADRPATGSADGIVSSNSHYVPFPLGTAQASVEKLMAQAAEKLNSGDLRYATELRLLRDHSSSVTDEFSPLVSLYDECLILPLGLSLRFDMLRRYVDAMMLCRRLNMLRLLCPPGPVRYGQQYAFPQCGLFTPTFEFPLKRYRLFESRKNDCYTFPEILSWFSSDVFDEEDRKMQQAEIDGQKRRKYLEWLALESVRQAQTRNDMLEEDRQSRRYRQYWKAMDRRLKEGEISRRQSLAVNFSDAHDKFAPLRVPRLSKIIKPLLKGGKLGQILGSDGHGHKHLLKRLRSERVDEDGNTIDDDQDDVLEEDDEEESNPTSDDEDENEDEDRVGDMVYEPVVVDKESAYAVSTPIPAQFDYLVPTEDDAYQYGCGTENDDEMEDFKEESRLAALRREEEERQMKQKMLEERLRKEREEAFRLKREEQDRRLEEGMERRRHARERFEELKQKRAMEQEELKRIQAEKLALAEAQRIERERIAAQQLLIQQEKDRQTYERQAMYAEEMYLREVVIINRELREMEEEDIISSLREMKDFSELKAKEERVAYLTKLYEPFVPFKFNKVRLPILHSLLATNFDGDQGNGTGQFDYMFPKGDIIAHGRRNVQKSLQQSRSKSALNLANTQNSLRNYIDDEQANRNYTSTFSLLDSRNATHGSSIITVPKKPKKLTPISDLTPAEKLLQISSSARHPNYVDTFLGKQAFSSSTPNLQHARLKEVTVADGQKPSEPTQPSSPSGTNRRLNQSLDLARAVAGKVSNDNDSVSSGTSRFLHDDDSVSSNFISAKAKAAVLQSLAHQEKITMKETQKVLAMASLSSLGVGGGTLLPLNNEEHFLIPGLSGIRAKKGPQKKTPAFYTKAFGERDFKELQERKKEAAELLKTGMTTLFPAPEPAPAPSKNPLVPRVAMLSTRSSSPAALSGRASSAAQSGPARSPSPTSNAAQLSSRLGSAGISGRETPLGGATTARDRGRQVVIPIENGVARPDLLPLARAAGETVQQMKQSRETIKDYIHSQAYMHDKYFLAASIPVVRDVPYLEETYGPTRDLFSKPKYATDDYADEDEIQDDARISGKQDGPHVAFADLQPIDETSAAVDGNQPGTGINSFPTGTIQKKKKVQKFHQIDTKQVDNPPPFYRGTFGIRGQVAEIQKIPTSDLLEFKLNRKLHPSESKGSIHSGTDSTQDVGQSNLQTAVTGAADSSSIDGVNGREHSIDCALPGALVLEAPSVMESEDELKLLADNLSSVLDVSCTDSQIPALNNKLSQVSSSSATVSNQQKAKSSKLSRQPSGSAASTAQSGTVDKGSKKVPGSSASTSVAAKSGKATGQSRKKSNIGITMPSNRPDGEDAAVPAYTDPLTDLSAAANDVPTHVTFGSYEEGREDILVPSKYAEFTDHLAGAEEFGAAQDAESISSHGSSTILTAPPLIPNVPSVELRYK